LENQQKYIVNQSINGTMELHHANI